MSTFTWRRALRGEPDTLKIPPVMTAHFPLQLPVAIFSLMVALSLPIFWCGTLPSIAVAMNRSAFPIDRLLRPSAGDPGRLSAKPRFDSNRWSSSVAAHIPRHRLASIGETDDRLSQRRTWSAAIDCFLAVRNR